MGQAILISTTDAEGWSHPALLSYGDSHLTRFEARIEGVLADQAREDVEPGARITGGIMFDPGPPVKEVLQGWQAMVDGLRREA
jgi:hypothetical protein